LRKSCSSRASLARRRAARPAAPGGTTVAESDRHKETPHDHFTDGPVRRPISRRTPYRPERPGVFALCVLLAALLSIVLLRG